MDGLFDGLEVRQREPLDADTFKQEIVQRYAEQASSIGIDACIGEAVDAVWPAPDYRAHQRQAVYTSTTTTWSPYRHRLGRASR